MTNEHINVYLSPSSRCRSVETEKSYALKWRNLIVHIPKSQCEMNALEVEIDSLYRWEVNIPNWLINKNSELKEITQYLKDENNEKS